MLPLRQNWDAIALSRASHVECLMVLVFVCFLWKHCSKYQNMCDDKNELVPAGLAEMILLKHSRQLYRNYACLLLVLVPVSDLGGAVASKAAEGLTASRWRQMSKMMWLADCWPVERHS